MELDETMQPKASKGAPGIDPRQRALALGLEFSKRAVQSESLADLYFILTNDLRSLVGFDRAFVLTHFEGKSRFSAASNQPLLEKKSKYYENMTKLAAGLRDLQRGVLLSSKDPTMSIPDEHLYPEARQELKAYLDFSECSYLFCVPLQHGQALVGHLILEFFEDHKPSQIEIVTLLNLAPFFASAMSEQWLLNKKPRLAGLIDPARRRDSLRQMVRFYIPVLALVAIGAIVLLFFVPFDFDVGGESEVVPKDKHVAFAKMDGIIDQIFAKEGVKVTKGQVLATIDPKEINYEINRAEGQFDIVTREVLLLRTESGENPEKLAESRLLELKRKTSWDELQHLKWKKQFLEIIAPVSGIIITKDIAGISGKRFKAGEPFCELAVPGQLCVDVLVPEDRISYVRKGQEVDLYLNSEPSRAYSLRLDEVAPTAMAMPRLGNVFVARAPFPGAPPSVKVGMKGIGKIRTMRTSLWFMIAQRMKERWNHLSLYF